jgi:hypothetical protein
MNHHQPPYGLSAYVSEIGLVLVAKPNEPQQAHAAPAQLPPAARKLQVGARRNHSWR